MTIGERLYLALILAGFAIFAGTLAVTSWQNRDTKAIKPHLDDTARDRRNRADIRSDSLTSST
jgi:hypothetical protein